MDSVFYCQNNNNKFILEENEIHHLKVLRIKLPKQILFTDGNGVLYKGLCNENFEISEYKELKTQNKEFVNIFFGICEKKRMKLIFEKCTEIGVKEFFPIYTEKSGKLTIKKEKAELILRSAVKQSRRFFIPKYNEPQKLYDIDIKYFKNAYFGSIKNSNKKIKINKKIMNIFIGPPSGFTDNEENFLINNGVKTFHFDSAVLKTETFAVSILSIIHYIKGVENE